MTAYKAVGEFPEVYCAYGNTPVKATKAMAKLMKKHNVSWWSSSSVTYLEDDGEFCMTIYV